MRTDRDAVTFVVGEERSIAEILRAEDVRPLFQSVIGCGAVEVRLDLADGVPLCVESSASYSGRGVERSTPLMLEGEEVGRLVMVGSGGDDHLDGLFSILETAVNVVLRNNMKRLLTTEMHTAVVTRSHDELLRVNEELARSEQKYRRLSEELELRVRERTRELEEAHLRLLQQEKLASVGVLAAGIAHEINNPMGFIISNLQTLSKYLDRLFTLVDALRPPGGTEGDERFSRLCRELKLDFIRGDAPQLIRQSLDGGERVKRIVLSLKAFSHIDEAVPAEFSPAAEIDHALEVAATMIPADTVITRSYEPVPMLRGNGAAFSQAMLALVQNACDAVPRGLHIHLGVRSVGGNVEITCSDNGDGIPDAILPRIFEPFFTTKPVGKGSGLGLSLVHQTVSSLGGSIEAGRSPDGGALFTIRIPSREGDA